jgi:hypothetical protein
VMPSSETETCSRGRSALDRDRASLEGASSPRARQNPARWGVRPSSEAEPRPRGRPALERGGNSPEGATNPRARRRLASAAPCPSSEAEFRPRVARPTVWLAVGATWAVGP